MRSHLNLVSSAIALLSLLLWLVEILGLEILFLLVSFHFFCLSMGFAGFDSIKLAKLVLFCNGWQLRFLLNIIISFRLLIVVALVIVSVSLRPSLVVTPLHVKLLLAFG